MSLDKRINLLNSKFLYKLLHNNVNDPELLERMNFRLNQSCSRNISLFYPSPINKTYMLYTPANVLLTTENSIYNVNIFNTTLFHYVPS